MLGATASKLNVPSAADVVVRGHSGRWTHALQLAADQIGIDSEFSTSTVLITISALLIGAALAFGFRSRASAGNILALHYVRQRYGSDRRSRA